MGELAKLISELTLAAQTMGFSDVSPRILSQAANLNVWLSPYPVVARLAILTSHENPEKARELVAREVYVSEHLRSCGVPVLSTVSQRVQCIGGIWSSFWEFKAPSDLPPLDAEEEVQRVLDLSKAMAKYPGKLPHLGTWGRVLGSAERLRSHSDPNVQSLVQRFDQVNDVMHQLTSLVPAHGDAHSGNLYACSEGWIWMDLEDASLMPSNWDLASFVANGVLFSGFSEPTLTKILADPALDRREFAFALTARVLFSILGNLDLALRGYGDEHSLGFAHQQLDRSVRFFQEIESL